MSHKTTTLELAVKIFLSKAMQKNLGVYFDATLYMAKHTDHISRSA